MHGARTSAVMLIDLVLPEHPGLRDNIQENEVNAVQKVMRKAKLHWVPLFWKQEKTSWHYFQIRQGDGIFMHIVVLIKG